MRVTGSAKFAACVLDWRGRGEDYSGAVVRLLRELDFGEDALCQLGLASADPGNIAHLREDGLGLVCLGFIDEEAIHSQIVEVDVLQIPDPHSTVAWAAMEARAWTARLPSADNPPL